LTYNSASFRSVFGSSLPLSTPHVVDGGLEVAAGFGVVGEFLHGGEEDLLLVGGEVLRPGRHPAALDLAEVAGRFLRAAELRGEVGKRLEDHRPAGRQPPTRDTEVRHPAVDLGRVRVTDQG
jgi:hypothetical protein